MELEEAKRLIRDDAASPLGWIAATGTIVACAETNPDLFMDLLQCLKRKGACSGPAIAVLYGRTGRSIPTSFDDYCRDPKEWENYLRENNFLG